MRRPRPSPRQITEAEEAMLWLRWLEKDDARLVWLRANRTPWKKICWELGISRATANRRWQYGIAVIVWRLNGKRVPTEAVDGVRDQAGAHSCIPRPAEPHSLPRVGSNKSGCTAIPGKDSAL
jgi:hypothetical protein